MRSLAASRCPSWRDMRGRAGAGSAEVGSLSCSSSTACAWRSWRGTKRRRTPAWTATRCNSSRAALADQAWSRVGPTITQNSGPTGSFARCCAARHLREGVARGSGGCAPGPHAGSARTPPIRRLLIRGVDTGRPLSQPRGTPGPRPGIHSNLAPPVILSVLCRVSGYAEWGPVRNALSQLKANR